MKVYSIQFLRAVAAILVVYCHSIDLESKFTTSVQEGFYFIRDFGAIGVDMFFVISGFIISYVGSQLSGKDQAVVFLKKRFVRINPSYYFFSFVAFVVLAIIAQRPSFTAVFKTLIVLPSDFGPLFKYPILSIGWTLSFEWYFYIIFTILIALKIKQKEPMLFASCMMLVGLGMITIPSIAIVRFMTNPIILEFGFGALIGWWYKKNGPSLTVAIVFLLTSLVWFAYLIGNGFGDVSEADNLLNGDSGASRLLLWGTPSILLTAGIVFVEKNSQRFKKIFGNNTTQLLGDASYAIYLIHPIVFYILHTIFAATGFYGNGDLMIIFQLAVAVFLGTIAHIFIERPIMRHAASFLKISK